MPKSDGQYVAGLLLALEKYMVVYIYLIGWNVPRLCQSQISKKTGLKKSTISDCARKLCKEKYLVRVSKGMFSRYEKGPMYRELEAMIKAKIEGAKMSNDLVVSKRHSTMFVRRHRNGGWLDINVIKEGRLESFFYPPTFGLDPIELLGACVDGNYDIRNIEKAINEKRKSEEPIHLYENKLMRPTGKIKGRVKQYSGSFDFNGKLMKLQYHLTTTGKMFLRISPGEVIQPAQEALKQHNDSVNPYYEDISGFLTILEKYAGWKFEKMPDGSFKIDYKGDSHDEFGLDEVHTRLIKEFCPEFGIPGKTPVWTDNSPGSMGDGEVEGNIEFIDALESLPESTRMIREMFQCYSS